MLAKKTKVQQLTGMKWVKELREKKGVTAYGLAAMLGTTYQRIQRLEEAQGCRMDILVALRDFFGLTWEQMGKLIEREVGPSPSLQTRPYKAQKKKLE